MSDTAPARSISLAWDLPHPPSKVWRALTEPELLAKWLMPNDMRPAAGARFTFRNEPTPWWDGIVNCEVIEIDPHSRLRYSWRSGSGASALDTEVTWTLTPTASGGTRLALEQTGFLPKNSFALDGATTGWDRMVGERLRALLAELDTG